MVASGSSCRSSINSGSSSSSCIICFLRFAPFSFLRRLSIRPGAQVRSAVAAAAVVAAAPDNRTVIDFVLAMLTPLHSLRTNAIDLLAWHRTHARSRSQMHRRPVTSSSSSRCCSAIYSARDQLRMLNKRKQTRRGTHRSSA